MASACGRETSDGGEALQLREMLERIFALNAADVAVGPLNGGRDQPGKKA